MCKIAAKISATCKNYQNCIRHFRVILCTRLRFYAQLLPVLTNTQYVYYSAPSRQVILGSFLLHKIRGWQPTIKKATARVAGVCNPIHIRDTAKMSTATSCHLLWFLHCGRIELISNHDRVINYISEYFFEFPDIPPQVLEFEIQISHAHRNTGQLVLS